MDIANTGEGGDSQNIAAKGAALLLVIGEPFSEEHKKLILGDITKGGSLPAGGVTCKITVDKLSPFFIMKNIPFIAKVA